MTLLLDSSFWKFEWSLIASNDFFITHFQNSIDINVSIHLMRQLCMWGYESNETCCYTVGNEATAWRREKASWRRERKSYDEGERKSNVMREKRKNQTRELWACLLGMWGALCTYRDILYFAQNALFCALLCVNIGVVILKVYLENLKK